MFRNGILYVPCSYVCNDNPTLIVHMWLYYICCILLRPAISTLLCAIKIMKYMSIGMCVCEICVYVTRIGKTGLMYLAHFVFLI